MIVEVVFQAHRVSLRHYHPDQAGELQGSETLHYLLELIVHDATHSESAAYTPARNAIAERKFRTLSEMTAAMLFDSGLPKTFWGYAYLAATHVVRNRITLYLRYHVRTATSIPDHHMNYGIIEYPICTTFGDGVANVMSTHLRNLEVKHFQRRVKLDFLYSSLKKAHMRPLHT